jgi:hypothetical protein
MDREDLSEIADQIHTGAIVYHSTSGDEGPWEPAGVVLRLEGEGIWTEPRLLVITTEQSVESLGQIAERGGDVAVDLHATSTDRPREPVSVEDLLGDLAGADELLSPLERQIQVGSVSIPPILPPGGDDLLILSFTGLCIICGPHQDHIPQPCELCARGAPCNR